jgi:hypothetical protein
MNRELEKLIAEMRGWLKAVPKGSWRCYLDKHEIEMLLAMETQLRDLEERYLARPPIERERKRRVRTQ